MGGTQLGSGQGKWLVLAFQNSFKIAEVGMRVPRSPPLHRFVNLSGMVGGKISQESQVTGLPF